ncbi:Spindle-body formation-associated protein [Penicillium angulare]|uniref:Spindle-body formation-associated protein n=1 Tax=Penicillium angulare TaxID=116970 RepID=UPI002542203C|nr:Spindle-body formation-associated protein [Penicillium angulare]KAJ5287203.1 Spindle-body formation-associated protein [Penicillium angulare]
MLDWMKGNEGPEAADTTKVLEPPETPAAMFAMRAFKSALFGTPGAEDNDQTPRPAQPKESNYQRRKSDTTTNPIPIPIPEKLEPKPDLDSVLNPSGSPTKSILVTPGTISNRRKTVSFGEGVVDNEGKRDSHSIKVVKTPPNPSGNLSTQWMSGSADGKPRSKLTQTLLDARDNATKNSDSDKTTEASSSSGDNSVARPQTKTENEPDDITLNLDEPRSESGKYWKTEFDNYRVRTNREIKKLIHYRTIAKSYARKKDSEALRLSEKLKEEEEKVTEMERQVSRLASSIVGQGSTVDKEQLIQDLTRQTALALQYKQQVTALRSSLEQQGVVSAEVPKDSEPAKFDKPEQPSPMELHRTQQELKEANAKIDGMKRQNTDLSTLQNLAESSERKAQELEKENNSLKQTLARVKLEMSRYEGRRKEKENKLKQRETKLEARIQEYRERLKTTTQEHRQSEDALRKGFDDERRRMQTQIDQLKTRVSAVERAPTLRPQQRRSLSPRKEYTGVHVQDFAGQDHDHPGADEEANEDIEGPPSPSPRSKSREARHTRNSTTSALDLKRKSRDLRDITADDAQVKEYLAEVLHRPTLRSRHTDLAPVPPSSPPDIEAFKSLGRGHSRYHPAGDNQRTYRSLYLRGSELTDTDANTQPAHANTHRPLTHIKSTLDTLSGQTTSRVGNYAGHTISGGERPGKKYGLLADLKSEPLSPERVAAAKSRLRQKRESQRLRPSGKENF